MNRLILAINPGSGILIFPKNTELIAQGASMDEIDFFRPINCLFVDNTEEGVEYPAAVDLRTEQ